MTVQLLLHLGGVAGLRPLLALDRVGYVDLKVVSGSDAEGGGKEGELELHFDRSSISLGVGSFGWETVLGTRSSRAKAREQLTRGVAKFVDKRAATSRLESPHRSPTRAKTSEGLSFML